jgi:hypothetical protein
VEKDKPRVQGERLRLLNILLLPTNHDNANKNAFLPYGKERQVYHREEIMRRRAAKDMT